MAVAAAIPLILAAVSMAKGAIDKNEADSQAEHDKAVAKQEADRAARSQPLSAPIAPMAQAEKAPEYTLETAKPEFVSGGSDMQSTAQSILGLQQQLPGFAKGEIPHPSDPGVVRPGNMMGTPDPLTGTVSQLSAPSVVNMQKWISDWSPFTS